MKIITGLGASRHHLYENTNGKEKQIKAKCGYHIAVMYAILYTLEEYPAESCILCIECLKTLEE